MFQKDSSDVFFLLFPFYLFCQSVCSLQYFDFRLIGDLSQRGAVQTRDQHLFSMSLRDYGHFIFDRATRKNLPVSANTHRHML